MSIHILEYLTFITLFQVVDNNRLIFIAHGNELSINLPPLIGGENITFFT